MVHQLTADPVRLTAKPEPTQIALIKKRMQRATVQTVRDFIEDIGVGISWSGGIFKNDHLKNKNFIQASIVALDFDGEGALTPQQAIDRIQKYQITPSCWYPSFSDDPQGTRKFRLVFFLDRPIKDQNAYSTLMTLFFELYPEVDRLKDAARFCYGTNSEGVVLNPDEIPLDDLVTVLRTHAISKAPLHKNRHKTKGGKALQASFADCVYNNSINSKHSERKVMKQRYGRLKKNMKKNVDWDKLASRVKVFDQFLNGDERLRYSQLEGIATNLAWMKSGSRVYKDTLEKFNKKP